LAVGAGEGVGWRKVERDFGGLAEEAAQELAVLFGGSGGEAVVAHPHEAFWQDVETPAPNELEDVEVEDGGFLGGAVGPFEEDVSLGVVAEDAFGAEGTALDVSRKRVGLREAWPRYSEICASETPSSSMWVA